MTTALIALQAVAIAFLAVLVAGLLRSHAEILRALHRLGVGIGDPADQDPAGTLVMPSQRRPDGRLPDVRGTSPEGGPVEVAVSGHPGTTLLAFLTTGCLSCRPLWERLGEASLSAPAGRKVVVVTKGPEAESPAEVARLVGGARVPVVMSSDAWEAYRIEGSPFFVLVDGETGLAAGEGTATSWEQVDRLVAQAGADAQAGPHQASAPAGLEGATEA